MIVPVTLYSISIEFTSWGKKTLDEFKQEQKIFEGLDFLSLADYDPKEEYTQEYLSCRDHIVTPDQLLSLATRNIKFNVNKKIDTNVDMFSRIQQLAEKPNTILSEPGTNIYNSKCEVHMPGQALSLYNEMLLLEDECTDVLQKSLCDGWRIIAACPQPDQRRPDYILGRHNPEHRGDEMARRF